MSLIIQELAVALGGNNILRDINLEIEEGEFFTLLGPSGCGKSTLLKTIAGLIRQQRGSIRIGDMRLDTLPPHKRDIVLVFQDLRLFPHMTAVENVAFPMKMRGENKKDRLRTASELLRSVQLEGLEYRMPSQLSGGQQQRVVLARALAANPRVLLLDEPFSSLDHSLRDDMRDLLHTLHRRFSTTMVLVTHDHTEAFQLSDHIAVMGQGVILQQDTPQGLFSQPRTLRIAKYFIRGNQIPGSIKDGMFCAGRLTIPAAFPDGQYTAVIRMGDIATHTEGVEFRINKLEYLGGVYRASAMCEGSLISFMASDAMNCQEGEIVYLKIPPDKVLFYPEQAE